MTDSKKNNPLMMIFFLILLVCSVLGAIAFVMQFTDKKCPSPSPASERYQQRLRQARSSGIFDTSQGSQRNNRGGLAGLISQDSPIADLGSIPVLGKMKPMRKKTGMGKMKPMKEETCVDKCMQQCAIKSTSSPSPEHYGGCYKKKKKSTSEHYWGI